MLIPRLCAAGAAYLNTLPISATPAAEALAVPVNRSATLLASFASKPKPFKADETVSDTTAKSSPEAAAADKTPGIMSII